MKQDKLRACILGIAPPGLAEEWDNSGIQLYAGKEEIQRVLVCLDVTETVVQEALHKEVDWIISHHPLIFDGIQSIDADTPLGRMLVTLIKGEISVFSAHMTYDKAPHGNSVSMAKRLGLTIAPAGKDRDGNPDYSFLVAELERPMEGTVLLGEIKDKLQIPSGVLRFSGLLDQMVSRIGICAGSGGDFLQQAHALGCQALVTGDVKHHQAIHAGEWGMLLVDAGHYDTEKFFVPDFSAQLEKCVDDSLELICYTEEFGPIIPLLGDVQGN